MPDAFQVLTMVLNGKLVGLNVLDPDTAKSVAKVAMVSDLSVEESRKIGYRIFDLLERRESTSCETPQVRASKLLDTLFLLMRNGFPSCYNADGLSEQETSRSIQAGLIGILGFGFHNFPEIIANPYSLSQQELDRSLRRESEWLANALSELDQHSSWPLHHHTRRLWDDLISGLSSEASRAAKR